MHKRRSDVSKVALFDMDDTLADYNGQLMIDLKKIASPFEPEITDIERGEIPYLEARRHMITSQSGWFRNLPKFKLGWDILDAVTRIGFSVVICTKGPTSKPAAWTEKLQWCQEHLKGVMEGVTITGNKGLVYGRVLVDDCPDYILGWLEYRPRGLVIMPAHPKNEGFTHPQVIRYDGSIDSFHEVIVALAIAFNREEGEEA
jgi:5'(3')-deoxyribonucleotidase